jgi:prepilin-type N-terminal cleavage/methylation domain-containing protein
MRQFAAKKPSSLRVLRQGFTIIELLIVIVVVMIVAAISIDANGNYQERARDSEREADMQVIANNLERYYRTQPSANGTTYPPANTTPANLALIIDNPDAIIAPGQTESSLVMVNTVGNKSPSLTQYMYQPMKADGSICTSTPCARYKLYYKYEVTGVVASRDSMRQQ